MNILIKYSLKISRKLYSKVAKVTLKQPKGEQDPDIISALICEGLNRKEPFMVARFGSTELACLANYYGIKIQSRNHLNYVFKKAQPWWWESGILDQMQRWSGFFPASIPKIEQFCEMMIKDMKQLDVLGSWLTQEILFEKEIDKAAKVRLIYLEPYWSKQPWTAALKGKKVLVIHPFAETIEKQYKKRKDLFATEVLPDFTLITIKAVQSLGGENSTHNDWFDALESMKTKIDAIDFDICLIGAGAYGFPLAAHVKRIGKKSVHLGGSLQLLFGIKGKRWENPDYGKALNLSYLDLFNSHWVRATTDETPVSSSKVEGACYW